MKFALLLPLVLSQVVDVLLIPHSHTDPGWLKTVDEYYIENVRYILYNIVTELDRDPSRRFTWAETCYLKMFYEDS
jgi:alpha-mannosidase II